MKKALSSAAIILTALGATLYVWLGMGWDRGRESWMITSYFLVLGVVALITWQAAKYGWKDNK